MLDFTALNFLKFSPAYHLPLTCEMSRLYSVNAYIIVDITPPTLNPACKVIAN